MKAKRIALVSGGWGQNIGNAFFNIGGKWILDSIFPHDRVQFVLDQPGYQTFNNQAKGNPKNDFGLLKYLEIDYVVLQGPMFTVNFPKLWGETFEALTARGTRIILLSAAMFRFTEEEKATTRAFLSKYRPVIISTRDIPTYEAVKGAADFTYCGIDSGFFAPDAYKPFRLTCPEYIAVNFDRWPEPDLMLDAGNSHGHHHFKFDGHDWSLAFPKLQWSLATNNKVQSYLGAALDFRTLPKAIGEYLIVRPEHRYNPPMLWKIYKHPNAVAWDEPWTYFTVYANTKLTLSDRVHACVATLAYGNPAMLFTPSPRASLFERLALTGIKQAPLALDSDYLCKEKTKQLEFLRHAVSCLS